MDLPQELWVEIVRHLPPASLPPLFGVPGIGDFCFARYYRSVKVVGARNFVDRVARGTLVCDANPFAHPARQYPYAADGPAHVEFTYSRDFVDFCEANKVILDRVKLETVSLPYHAYEELAPYLRHFRVVGLQLAFSLEVNDTIDAEFEGFQTAVTQPVRALDFACLSRQMRFRLYDKFASLASLSVSRVVLEDRCLANLVSLRSLEVQESLLKDSQLADLPQSLTHIKLVRSLQINGSQPLPFPPGLQILEIKNTISSPDRFGPARFELDHLEHLECVYFNACGVSSLSEASLPSTIKHIIVRSSTTAVALSDLYQFKHLESLHFLEARCSGLIDVFAGGPLPSSLRHLRFYYDQEIDLEAGPQNHVDFIESQVRAVGSIPIKASAYAQTLSRPLDRSTLSISTDNNVDSFTCNITGPLQVLRLYKVLHLTNLNSLTIPDSVEVLDINLHLDDQELVLPPNLKELTLMACRMKTLNIRNLSELGLSKLSLNSNHFKDGAVAWNTIPSSIEHLDLSNNFFSHVDVSHCTQLKSLSILSCSLKTLSSATLNIPSSVRDLVLCSNRIESIEQDFQFPKHLKVLSMTNHRVPILSHEAFWSKVPADIEELELTPKVSARYLDIKSTQFKHLKSLMLGRARDAENLLPLLSNCSILEHLQIDVEDSTFDLDQLPGCIETLEIAYIGVVKLQGDLKGMNKLRTFDLSIDDCGSYEDDVYMLGVKEIHISNKIHIPPQLEYLQVFEVGVDDIEDVIDFSSSRSLKKVEFLRKHEQQPHDTTSDKIHSQPQIKRVQQLIDVLKAQNDMLYRFYVNTWVPSNALSEHCRSIGVDLRTSII